MKIKQATEYVLLGSLMSGPKHGYEIISFLQSSLISTWQISTSQLYALLKRLEKETLLRAQIQPQDNRPSKRVFSVTDKGKEQFKLWLYSPVENGRDFRMEFLAKLFFIHHLSLEGGDDLIEGQIERFQKLKKNVVDNLQGKSDPFTELVWGYKSSHLDHLVTWLLNQAKPFIEKEKTHNFVTIDTK